MDNISTLIEILRFLLPGFVTAWIFFGLTSHPRRGQFERLVQALIFTILVQGLLVPVREFLIWFGKWKSFGVWTADAELIVAICLAIALGLVVSYFANFDGLHSTLRKLKLTRQTAYSSEWFGAFLQNITWIVLHFHDGKRLYGWPIEWPSDPEFGHFLMVQAAWLHGDKAIELNEASHLLVSAKDVRWVEFVNLERKNGKEATESTATKRETTHKGKCKSASNGVSAAPSTATTAAQEN